jgi:hypothetical protein
VTVSFSRRTSPLGVSYSWEYHLHIMPSLRICGTIRPVYSIPPIRCHGKRYVLMGWCLVKHRDNCVYDVYLARLEVFTATKTEVVVLWLVTPCRVMPSSQGSDQGSTVLRTLVSYHNTTRRHNSEDIWRFRSKARTVFGRSNTGIVGSNPTRGMDVCPRFCVFVLSFVGRGLTSGRSPVQGVLLTV